MPSVLILGALSDVAKALAHEYARNGYDLFLAARDKEKLQPLSSDIQVRYQRNASVFSFDARKFAEHAAFYNNLPGRPDVVIAVFGYLGDTEKGMHDWNEAQNIIESNYTGAVSILNIAAVDMMERKSGTIIGISSVAGERGRQSNFLYGSAKAGFTAYLSGLRNKLFHSGVHVLTVKPGFIATAMTEGMPLNPKLTAQPEKVAKDIFKAAQKKKNVIFTLWMWKYIMCIIRNIPEGVFKKLKM
jgi:short-subunit dehydrogenase